MTYDLNNSKDVRNATNRAKRREEKRIETMRMVMQVAEVRAVVRGIIGLCDLMNDGYIPGDLRAQRQQDYEAGRRSIGLDILKMINLHMSDLGEMMMAEHHAQEKREREEDEAAALDAEPVEQEQNG